MEHIDFANAALLLGAALIVAGILSSLIATRFGAPILLIFLGIGMLAGEDGPGGIRFSDYSSSYLIGSLALAIILFDGGLNTKLATSRRALAPAITLATAGVVITAALTAAVAIFVLHLRPVEGFLLGAIVGSTDPAAVFFLLRSAGLQLKNRVGATIEIESAVNDPVALFMAVAAITIASGGFNGWDSAALLARQAFVGAAVGVGGGFALVALLNRIELPSGLHPLLVVAAAVFFYALSARLDGSGFLAAYLAGLVVSNRPVRALASIASLNEAVTWLAQIVMFLVLGLLVTPHRLLEYALPALAVVLFLMFVARPVAVFLCLAPFRFPWRDKLFVSWVGLRGAVSIFLSAMPILVGLPKGELYFNVAFFVVLVSLLLQGWTIRWSALKLRQALPRPLARVSRVELDLPGQLDLEMVGYPIGADSHAFAITTLPSWARLVLVVREGRVSQLADPHALRPGDYAYFLAPPLKVNRLDRLFASTAEKTPPLGSEFALRGDAPIATIDDLYALGATPGERAMTVAQLFAERFDTIPEVGDTLPLGHAHLVVRGLDGDEVSRAGLQFDEEEETALKAALGHVARMRRWISGRQKTGR